MKVCPVCGHNDESWSHSRFDFNADYMRFDEAQNIPTLKEVYEFLKDKANFVPFKLGSYTFYRRGTGGLYLYRVLHADFKVPRERKKHSILKETKK
jgi:hypothetical protein